MLYFNQNAMNQRIEIINFNEKVPLRLSSCKFDEIKSHWHSDLEIDLVLKGKCTLITNDHVIELKEDDIYLINKDVVHKFKSELGCAMATLQIDIDKIPNFDSKVTFYLDSTATKNQKNFIRIKQYIAKLVKANASDGEENYLYNLSILYSILYRLTTNFKVNEYTNSQTNKHIEKLNTILKYIEDHYKEGISFADIADAQHYSVPYLSSFFKHHFGVSFQTYYKDFRLERAVNDLLHTDASIETIASANGYPNPRAFVTAFKGKYKTLPSLYRKKGKVNNYKLTESGDDKDLYGKSTISLLSKYLTPKEETAKNEPELENIKTISADNIDVSEEGTALKHTFRKFISVGRAKELLLADVQKMLIELQNEVHYEYIKFHGLLSDDMLVYEEDADGRPLYSFVYIDKVIDFLLSIHLRPLIQFSFMPKALAKDTNRLAYSSPFVLSMPKSMERWNELIYKLTTHLIDRYSFNEVQKWLFCCWNEPDTSTSLFGFPNDEDYYQLYQETYRTIKGIDSRLTFGSPSLLISYNINQLWCHHFISWCQENSCTPDFMNIHYYDNDFSDASFSEHRPAKPSHSKLNKDEYSFSKCISKIKALFKDWGIESLPIYLTEWNLTVSHRNLLNDTCFKSCYLAKNLLENYDRLESFGYWVLTDMIEETLPSKEQFHGGLGLYTNMGIKKPHYYVFRFINRLGDQLLAKGNGYFITKSKNKIQIMTYNYEHFNHLFAQGETFDMNFLERYTPFNKLGPMEIAFELCNIKEKKAIIREEIINQTYGSAFDEWIRMGASPLNREDIDYLKNVSVPKRYVRVEKIENDTINFTASLEPLEVRFVEIELKETI